MSRAQKSGFQSFGHELLSWGVAASDAMQSVVSIMRKSCCERESLVFGRMAGFCGFVDQSHFTRVFAAMICASPGLWRRMNAYRVTWRLTFRSGTGVGLKYTSGMIVLRWLAIAGLVAGAVSAQEAVSFATEDGGHVYADLYGHGTGGVVLAHDGRFTKESWADQARVLAKNGFLVLAIEFRGFGASTGPGQADFYTAPYQKDVLAAVRYLKAHGAKTVSVVGGSFGGAAAGDASIDSPPGEIDRVVLLGAAPNLPAEGPHSRSLFVVARDDMSGDGPRLPTIRAQFERAPEPKQLIVLDGSAHAQFLFQTDQADRVMREILRFLSAP